MRWWPQSLFGRLMGVLAGGMLVAQLLSAALNFAERDNLLQTASGMQQVQRVTDVVKLLDSLGSAERERIVAVLSVPPLVLSLHGEAFAPAGDVAGGARTTMFTSMLRAALGDARAIRVEPGEPFSVANSAGAGYGHRQAMMGGGPGMDRAATPGGPVLRTQVQLRDGSWARFDTELPQAAATLPWRLALTLLLLLCAVLALSFVAVRWITRPLHVLATAAEGLGQDIDRPP
ncbi:MAG: two-component sensor histidine kinase, partial [Polaromonas sp.]|nr:two-component sensor histidine kinase [Polaromonas sp.]